MRQSGARRKLHRELYPESNYTTSDVNKRPAKLAIKLVMKLISLAWARIYPHSFSIRKSYARAPLMEWRPSK